MLIIGSNDSRVPSLVKGLSFAVEARRGFLAISNRSFGGCLRHFSRPSCTPRARLPLNGGGRDREETPIRGKAWRRRDGGTLVQM